MAGFIIVVVIAVIVIIVVVRKMKKNKAIKDLLESDQHMVASRVKTALSGQGYEVSDVVTAKGEDGWYGVFVVSKSGTPIGRIWFSKRTYPLKFEVNRIIIHTVRPRTRYPDIPFLFGNIDCGILLEMVSYPKDPLSAVYSDRKEYFEFVEIAAPVIDNWFAPHKVSALVYGKEQDLLRI
jgi:hypothetical protein